MGQAGFAAEGKSRLDLPDEVSMTPPCCACA